MCMTLCVCVYASVFTYSNQYLNKIHGISFLGCCNKVPETGWLKTTEIYCLTVLEARSLKSRCH